MIEPNTPAALAESARAAVLSAAEALREAVIDFALAADRCGGDVAKTAAALGVKRDTVRLLRLRTERAAKAANEACRLAVLADLDTAREHLAAALEERATADSAAYEIARALFDPGDAPQYHETLRGMAGVPVHCVKAKDAHAAALNLQSRVRDLEVNAHSAPVFPESLTASVNGGNYRLSRLADLPPCALPFALGEYIAAAEAFCLVVDLPEAAAHRKAPRNV